MTNARRRAGFAQKTKPRRFITEIFFADDFQCHGAVQIDVDRFVSDPHRTATQLDRFPVFALQEFIIIKPVYFQLGRGLAEGLFGRKLEWFNFFIQSSAEHADWTELRC